MLPKPSRQTISNATSEPRLMADASFLLKMLLGSPMLEKTCCQKKTAPGADRQYGKMKEL
ncbi:hypothetical protein BPA01_21720 [Brevibacillus parabrevis]|uniref:Uncharacterized protein n=1 Tax=Brevibacillus parabrevis TaxID=54914 RepID=A0A4Y3PDT3_BREPA|nr:hypothetical protein BPA01_21720 [Brevibacillus parabrevis]